MRLRRPVRFRWALLTLLLSLVLFAILAIGVISRQSASASAENLAAQLLSQTSYRIQERVEDFLQPGTKMGKLNAALLETGHFKQDKIDDLIAFWLQVMETQPHWSRLSVGMEKSGEWYYVRRTPERGVAIGELRRDPKTGRLGLFSYMPKDYPTKPFFVDLDKEDEDPRKRSWYQMVRASGRQEWSETYVLFGMEGAADVPGVSCGTPFFDKDKKLVGVLTTTFDLRQISAYLGRLNFSREGIAFVVEAPAGGRHKVIAHPQPEILLRVGPSFPGQPRQWELVPIDELSDPRVTALLAKISGEVEAAQERNVIQVPFEVGGVRYRGTYAGIKDYNNPDWIVCTVIPEHEIFYEVERNNRITSALAVLIVLVSMVAALYLSGIMTRALEQLTEETIAVGQWRLEPRPKIESVVLEIDRLAQASAEMKTSLRSFRKYVPGELVRSLFAAGIEAQVGGEDRVLTMCFTDLANFTTVSESLSPTELVAVLGDYLQSLSDEIVATGGTIDKYIGDAIMAFWGAPLPMAGHALAACQAALRCQDRMKALRARWKSENKPLFYTRIGLHTGEVVVGNIGSNTRLNYSVIGDAVNTASRIEGLNKHYGTEIMITAATHQEVGDAVVARPLDYVQVKGKKSGMLVYELVGLKGEVDSQTLELVAASTRGLEAYRRQDWNQAIAEYEIILRLRPNDGPAQLMIARCRQYALQGPGENWNGVWEMHEK